MKIWGQHDSDTTMKSFLSIVDLSSCLCYGFTYILGMVDPVSRHGYALVMKNDTEGLVDFCFFSLGFYSAYHTNYYILQLKYRYVRNTSSVYPM
jgi:hypothetical protein